MIQSVISVNAKYAWSLKERINLFPSYLRSKFFPARDPELVYIVESADWSIRWDGIYITKGVAARGLQSSIDTSPLLYANRILHFGSSGTYARRLRRFIDSSNKIVITFFHGNYDNNQPEMNEKIDLILAQRQHIDRLVVSTSIMRERFLSWGFPQKKIVQIPIGVDLQHFHPPSGKERLEMRRRLNIPEGAIVIGSFQKDGNGWGEGLEPKLIKGPDVFVEVVLQLAKKYPVHCLLTGPARGYVKKELERGCVPYTHHFLESPQAVAKYYNALDLYLVTSREEGGPKSIMESMAAGVPLVSTHVGMAPDIIRDGINGFMLDIDDVDGIVGAAEQIIKNESQTERIINNALMTVQDYDWDIISEQYMQMYDSLFAGS